MKNVRNKLYLSVIMCFILLLAALFVTADTDSIGKGDVNGDGDITVADALEVLQFSIGKIDRFSCETVSSTESGNTICVRRKRLEALTNL